MAVEVTAGDWLTELTLDVQEDTVSFVIDYTDSLDTVKVLHLVPAV